MIIPHFHLQPQFIYELFHINFTSKPIRQTKSASQIGSCITVSIITSGNKGLNNTHTTTNNDEQRSAEYKDSNNDDWP